MFRTFSVANGNNDILVNLNNIICVEQVAANPKLSLVTCLDNFTFVTDVALNFIRDELDPKYVP